MAVIVSSRGGGAVPRIHSAGTWSGCLAPAPPRPRGTRWRVPRGCQAAGAAVGGVAPGAGQAGDDRGGAAADHQGEPGGQLADHVRRGDIVAGGVVLAADLPRGLPAQRRGGLQVVVSVMPGRKIFTEEVSRTIWRPWSPQRSASWASPWTTAATWIPLPPESASQEGAGPGRFASPRREPINSGGSSRPPGEAWPIWAAA